MIFIALGLFSIASTLALYFTMPRTMTEQERQNNSLKAFISQYLCILKEKAFLYHNLPSVLMVMTIIAWVTDGPFIVMHTLQQPSHVFVYLQILFFSFWALGLTFTNTLVRKFGATKILTISFSYLIVINVLFLLALFIHPDTSWHIFCIFYTLNCLGFGASLGPVQRRLIEHCKKYAITAVMAISSVFFSIGALISSASVSYFNYLGFNPILTLTGMTLCCGALVAFFGQLFLLPMYKQKS
jgi:DHA1 family multidrug/chloramphenicol efflux transport protein-like MFS transporter